MGKAVLSKMCVYRILLFYYFENHIFLIKSGKMVRITTLNIFTHL